MATTTASKPSARSSEAVASVLSRMRASVSARRSTSQRETCASSWRLGALAQSATWPPSAVPRSNSVTRWPRFAAVSAARSPAGPPPTTATLRGRVVGSAEIVEGYRLSARYAREGGLDGVEVHSMISAMSAAVISCGISR